MTLSSEGAFVVSPGTILPPAPVTHNPLDTITPVTDSMLSRPEGEWLTWRHAHNAHGFSPLKQITKANVRDLRVAWSWALPGGPIQTTPLVHDGVMFVQSFGDKL